MGPILSRILVRVAIVAASLAWAGFVVTQTVGDPDRGEQIAAAVLADDDARSEVAAPITSAVLRTAALPASARPLVAEQVDRLLLDPVGAQAFIDPFAGSWARMLGEDDPRPAEFDLAPLLVRFAELTPGAAALPVAVDRLPVPGVPLPRSSVSGVAEVRRAISASVLPLALIAAGAFLAAFLTGDRRRVLRRFAYWAGTAGLAWVAIPPILVWAARRWTPGADAVISVALDEATSGLFPAALVLVAGGVLAFGGSFVVPPPGARADGSRRAGRTDAAARPSRATAGVPPTRRMPAGSVAAPVTQVIARTPAGPPDRTVDHAIGGVVHHTAELPTTVVRQMPVEHTAELPVEHTAELPVEHTAELPATVRGSEHRPGGEPPSGDRDELWEFYGSS